MISEAPSRNNHNEDDRIPDLRRCIDNAGKKDFPWWEIQRRGNTHVMIWAQAHDSAIVLAKRRDYYVLKTAYAEIKPHHRATFEKERRAFEVTRRG